MQANDSAALESVVTDDCTAFSERSVRSLTEKMTVLPDTGRVEDADDLYLVVSGSGSEYLVDTRTGACECADYEYRAPANGCKHLRRVRYATGETPIPEWVNADAIDPRLGTHTAGPVGDSSPPFPGQTTENSSLQTDGGVSPEKGGQTAVTGDSTDDGPRYTYHYEPAHVGGARYVRCTECGAECVPAKPDRMLHREGCSEDQR